MPAQIASILDGPAGPPVLPPAIDKASLRRLASEIAALSGPRLAALEAILVAAGTPEVSREPVFLSCSPAQHDATLALDLEALPVRVFRRVWHCVFDPAQPAPAAPKCALQVADVRDSSDSPAPKVCRRFIWPFSHLPDAPRHIYSAGACHPLLFCCPHSSQDEDDELRDDDELIPAGSPLPTKRKAPSSRSGKQKRSVHTLVPHPANTICIRRASSLSSRSDASASSQREYRFVDPAPHPDPGPSASGSLPAPQPATTKVHWVPPQRTGIPCSYHSPIPDFAPCTRTFSRVADMRRHIEHQHHEEEAQAVIDGRITRPQATLLPDDWKGKINKPTCEGCGQTFSRKDAVKRHQTETGAKVVDGVCLSCPGSGNGSAAGKKRARRK
ncbi:hypothetical protein CTheo_1740 [Ceratobasidium theobromae]|uniref:Uncharacterized protein n=1 Tax=Ceratobasidium theobromae TaxID=1582974 RepID=A0A5N5QT62_9AGAM|nr:hypothetical protein CTheo_1740 [Ceratobasidium theobromae]